MRMWMINPKYLCNQHLLGEHGEIHKHRHCFEKQYKMNGRIEPIVQIEPSSMKARHDEIAAEMTRRGMNHKSPFIQPDISYLPDHHKNAKVDIEISINDLNERCEKCRELLSFSLTNV